MRSMPSAQTEATETPSAEPRILRTAPRAARRSRAASNRRGPWGCASGRGSPRPPPPARRAARGRPRRGRRPATGPSSIAFRLEGEVGLFDDLEEGRRIGTRASHGAAMLASAPILRKSFPADWGGGREGTVGRTGGVGRTGFFQRCGQRQTRALELSVRAGPTALPLSAAREQIGAQRVLSELRPSCAPRSRSGGRSARHKARCRFMRLPHSES